MKPALSGSIRIENAAEYETALMAVEKLMEVAEDSPSDPLDPLISMLFTAIQAWEAKDPKLARWDDDSDTTEEDTRSPHLRHLPAFEDIEALVEKWDKEDEKLSETAYLNASPANRQHLERSIAKIKSMSDVVKKRFAAIPEQEKHGDLIDGEDFFQQLDEADSGFETAINQGLSDLKEGRVMPLDTAKARLTAQDPKVPNATTREALAESEDSDQLERISSIDELLRQLDSVDASNTLKAAARLELMAVAERYGITLGLLEANDGIELIERVQSWFKTETAAVQWFLAERLPSFGELTPAQVIQQHGDRGVNELLAYIEAKEIGGFE